MKRWRIAIVFIIIIIPIAAIISRLVYLQIIQFKFYKALAQGQQALYQSEKGERGRIFFSGGQLLAGNIKGKYVFAVPAKIDAGKKEEVFKNLSKILGIDEKKVAAKIEKNNLFERIKIGLTNKEIEDLKNANLPEVYISEKEEVFRKYPQADMASQLVGFLGGEGVGQYGVEGYYDDILQGKESFNTGSEEFNSEEEKFINGSDIYLTIDYNIQFKTEELLKKAKENLDIESGQIIVADPNTGRIMALANFPNFNPDDYYDIEDFDIFQNSATQKLYEPGSIFKPITMASALDTEKVNPQTRYYDSGRIQVGQYTITNFAEKSYGERTMTEVLENSINTGAVFAEKQAGDDVFLKYVDRFGFFKPTGIDLQNESYSENKELKKGYEINYCTAAFGQGIEVTPMQIIKAFSAIANGGKLIKPYVAQKIVSGQDIKKTESEILDENVISDKTAKDLISMMVSVTENGFSKKARVPGYYMAGKTGTAQVSFSALEINKKGYSDKTWQSFIGFGPAYKPKFIILIKLDNPKANTAEYSAVPIFQELAKYMVDYLEIPPDHE